MKNNLLLLTLEKLDSKEVSQLKKFVASPFFNTSEQLITLLDFLLKYIHSNIIPNKTDLHQQIFSKKIPYNDYKIRLALSDLLKLVEDYIVYEQNQKKELHKQLALTQYYRKVGLEKHFNRVQRKAHQVLETTPYQNHEYYLAKNHLEWELYELASSKKRDIDINLQELGQNFDLSYFSVKLRQACILKAQQAFYNIEYDFQWVEQMLLYIHQRDWQDIPAISLYYYAYQMAANPEKDENFTYLKQQILKYSSLFPPNEIKEIYLLAINYCIKKLNYGKRDFAQEILKLYKKGLEIGCFLEKEILSQFTYANIVAAGLMVNDYNWTANFIEQYRTKLKKDVRQSAYYFNSARLAYVKDKNYEIALNFLQKISEKDLLNTLNAKILQLRIYYEIKEYSLLESHLEAMTNFIRRKEVIGYHKDNYLNIIKFTKRLLKVNFYDKLEIEKLKQGILAESTLSEKTWLLVQLESF